MTLIPPLAYVGWREGICTLRWPMQAAVKLGSVSAERGLQYSAYLPKKRNNSQIVTPNQDTWRKSRAAVPSRESLARTGAHRR